MDLATLGWKPALESAFAAHRAAGLEPARVAVEDKLSYLVFTADRELTGIIPGRLRHRRGSGTDLPKVGDWVAVQPLPGEDKAVIEAVLPRSSCLVRKVAGREIEAQVLAANVDTAFIVQALDESYRPRRLERFLVMAHEGGVRPVVVLNKADLCAALEERLAEARRSAGTAPILPVSAKTGHGLAQVRHFIAPGETVVFIGASGVGKSSLINRLYGDEIQATLEVRESDAKGRHATTWRELIPLPGGGLVIDTPGMREFHMWIADEGLEEAFPDVEALALQCHFRACTHTVETRCALRAAVADRRLTQARFEHYLKLKRELQYLAEERRLHTYQPRGPGGHRRHAPRPRPQEEPDDPG